MFSFKQKLSKTLVDRICPIGEKAMQMCEFEEDRLLEILDNGAKDAAKNAEATLAQAKRQMGILRSQL